MTRRTAIISGGFGGVGRAIGKRLSEDGFDIIVLDYAARPEESEKIFAAFSPGKHEAVKCDIRDGKALSAIVESIVKSRGRLDACVHGAVSPILRKDMLETSGAELREQLETGFFGGFFLLKEAALTMKKQGFGSIVGILSRAAQAGVTHSRMAAYAVGKYALRGVLRELAKELMPSHVSVNAVAPDFMDTRLNADLPEEVRRFVLERAPRSSIRSPEDAAKAVSFLCSEKGKSVNGKIFSFEAKEMENF